MMLKKNKLFLIVLTSVGALVHESSAHGPALISKNSGIDIIHAASYRYYSDFIFYIPCGQKKEKKILKDNYVIFESSRACINLSSEEQLRFLKSISSFVANEPKISKVIVELPQAIDYEDHKKEYDAILSEFGKAYHINKGNNFGIQLEWQKIPIGQDQDLEKKATDFQKKTQINFDGIKFQNKFSEEK